jgi:hypothetical protein
VKLRSIDHVMNRTVREMLQLQIAPIRLKPERKMSRQIRNGVKFDRVPIDSIKPSPHHARIHHRNQRRKLEKLVAQFGQVRPLTVTPECELIDGHGVWEALKAIGEKFADVAIVADQSPAGLRALALALNRSCQDTKWDQGKVRTEFEFLLDVGFDTSLTGFDKPEIEFIFQSDAPQANVIENAGVIPPRPEHPVSRLGDVYQLGEHRVGCGSALDPAFVNQVRGDSIPDCCIVDFPHGLPTRFFSGPGKKRHPDFVQGAGEMSSSELFDFFTQGLEVLRACSSARALICALIDWRHGLELTAAARCCGLSMLNLCVWTKTNPGIGSLYRSQYELCYVYKAGDQPHLNNVERHDRNRSNVWHYAGMSAFGAGRDAMHPSVKPTTLLCDIMRDVTRRGDIILDSFFGSGSTLISAEEIGRICIGVDLDPAYVDVAIRRWENLTGREAVHLQSGEPFGARAQRQLASPVEWADVR